MKKHIKKKFLHEVEISNELMEQIMNSETAVKWEDVEKVKSVSKDQTCLLVMDNNKVVTAFPYKYQGTIHWIPEPDPVLIYFHSAYCNYRMIAEKKKEILKILVNKELTEAIINNFYRYFGLTSGFIIFLFTALESFTNRCIKTDFIYKKADRRKTETYTKEQIEMYVSFDEKINIILPEVTGKDFIKEYPLKFTHIQNLKDFRDAIVHTKSSNEGHTPYDYLYKKSLSFDYEAAIESVKDFCNCYFVSNYIEECPCWKIR